MVILLCLLDKPDLSAVASFKQEVRKGYIVNDEAQYPVMFAISYSRYSLFPVNNLQLMMIGNS